MTKWRVDIWGRFKERERERMRERERESYSNQVE